MKIKKGDTVVVVAGKDLGKKGKVLQVLPKNNRVLVEGVNKIKKHQRPTRDIPQGGIINIEVPIHMSNVMYWDSKTSKPTRIGYKFLKTGEKVRINKRTGETID